MSDTSSSKKNKTYNPSWFLVILMLSIFWPVGLYLLWCKLQHVSQPVSDKKRKRRLTTGGLAMLLGSIFLKMIGGISGLWMVFMLAGGGALMVLDNFLEKREKRFARYANVVGSRASMSVQDIASAMGVSHQQALEDLKAILDEGGYLSRQAYLDLGEGVLVQDSRFAPEKKAKAEEPARARAPEQAQAKPQQSARGEESEYVKKLEQIRKTNASIKNERVSAQIDRIEQTTANIFELVVVYPAKRSEINTFMNYYLPTTLKLLTAYATLERQNVSGENINKSKTDIEHMLDQLVFAFERQNDQMFAREAMDISSDIKVMETMLAKDGLSEKQGGLPRDPFAKAVGRSSR